MARVRWWRVYATVRCLAGHRERQVPARRLSTAKSSTCRCAMMMAFDVADKVPAVVPSYLFP